MHPVRKMLCNVFLVLPRKPHVLFFFVNSNFSAKYAEQEGDRIRVCSPRAGPAPGTGVEPRNCRGVPYGGRREAAPGVRVPAGSCGRGRVPGAPASAFTEALPGGRARLPTCAPTRARVAAPGPPRAGGLEAGGLEGRVHGVPGTNYY